MKSPLNIRVLGLQPGIASVNNARIITEPHADFIEADAITGQQTGKCVAHRVRCHPIQPLCFAMFMEWPSKIVSVTVPAVFDVGPKHKRFTQAIGGKESSEVIRQGNSALLPVLEVDGGRFAQVQQPGSQIEPEWARLDDFVFAKPSVEATVQSEAEIIPRAGSNQDVTLFLGTKITHPSPHFFRDVKPLTGIAPTNTGDINAPVEKRANNRGVAVRGLGRKLHQFGIVKRLDVSRRHLSRGNLSNIAGKCSQDEPASMRARRCEFIFAPFVGKKRFNFDQHGISEIKFRRAPHFSRAFRGLCEIIGFKADELTSPFGLEIQPVNRTTEVNAARFRVSHTGLSRFDCHTCKPNSAAYSGNIPAGIGAGDETRTRDVLLGKIVASRVNCHTRIVTSA
jgi:hypothetical protein